MNFNSLSLSPALLQVAAELGFKKLTPIQQQSIPLLLEGKDLIGQSKTGSGKTAAFALPLLQKINLKLKRIQALVLCPTRELCTQVAREIRKFGRRHPGLQVIILSGGEPIHPQLTALKRGVHIAVGTPGRLLDHLRRPTFDLSQVTTVVLDEADRMLDMGFREDMEIILKVTPTTRQTLFFSATYPESIETMSHTYQKNPVKITIEDQEQAVPAIQQNFYEAHYEEKFQALLCLLQKYNPDSALIFCNLKVTVAELTQFLLKSGVSVACLHGDLEQNERNKVMAKFRNGSTRLLVATDVAARGLDIEKLDSVFNFDLPANPDIYVHRIGRTGRAGQKGMAFSLVTPREWGKVKKIEEVMGLKTGHEILDFRNVKSDRKIPFKDSKMETLYISCGRKDKMRPGDILGALTGEAGGLKGSDIGKIEIFDQFSYVAISKSVATLALQRLNNGKIKGRKVRVEKVR